MNLFGKYIRILDSKLVFYLCSILKINYYFLKNVLLSKKIFAENIKYRAAASRKECIYSLKP